MYLLYKSTGQQINNPMYGVTLEAGDILFAATNRTAREFNRMAEVNRIPTLVFTGDTAYIYTSKGWISHRQFESYMHGLHAKEKRISQVTMDMAIRTINHTIDRIRWKPYLQH